MATSNVETATKAGVPPAPDAGTRLYHLKMPDGLPRVTDEEYNPDKYSDRQYYLASNLR